MAVSDQKGQKRNLTVVITKQTKVSVVRMRENGRDDKQVGVWGGVWGARGGSSEG